MWVVPETKSVAECIVLMNQHSIGALMIVSPLRDDELVGVFTERDLIKHFEVLHMGFLWDRPVKAFMTRQLFTVGPGAVHQAPILMAKHKIRHIPVTRSEGGWERLLGLISMRDLFQHSAESLARNASASRADPLPDKRSTKIAGVVTEDPAVLSLIDHSLGLSRHLVMKAIVGSEDPAAQADQLSQLDGILLDIDGLDRPTWEEIVDKRLKAHHRGPLAVLFNPFLLDERTREDLKEYTAAKSIHLISKPLCQGLLLERFLRLV